MCCCGKGYNGWENYETWAVFTTITNEHDFYERAVEALEKGAEEFVKVVEDIYYHPVEYAPYWVEDAIGWFLKNVNYVEVAKALKEEIENRKEWE